MPDDKKQSPPTVQIQTGVPARVRVRMPAELVLRTDITTAQASELEDIFVLRSDFPKYEARMSTQADDIGDDGLVALRFEGLPKTGRFTLTVEHASGLVDPLFADVSFAELNTVVPTESDNG